MNREEWDRLWDDSPSRILSWEEGRNVSGDVISIEHGRRKRKRKGKFLALVGVLLVVGSIAADVIYWIVSLAAGAVFFVVVIALYLAAVVLTEEFRNGSQ